MLLVLRRDARPPLELFASYLILSGLARFLVEFLRINDPVVLGLTQLQLWALLSIAAGGGLIIHGRLRARKAASGADSVSEPQAATL